MNSFLSTLNRFGLQGHEGQLSTPTDLPDIYADEEEEDEPTRGGGAAVRQLHVEEDAEVDEPTGCRALFDLASGGRSDVGMKRRKNEDAMLVLEHECLYVVADGMGGHAGGEIASALAVEAIAATFLDKGEMPCVLSNVPMRGAELVQGFAAANEAVRSVASRKPRLSEMGTTVVAARFCPNKGRAYIGHVGDSRCYRLRDGVLQQMTRDHTMAEMGMTGGDAHRLSRAVGASGVLEADLMVVEPQEGDVFLLCSDGLTKTLPENVIVQILREQADPDAAADTLIARANAEGARDNVTAVVVRVLSP